METFETPDPKYIQGFNEGYLITKHLHSLKAINGLEKSPRGLGFQDGQKQFILEKNVERLSWMRTEKTNDQDPEKTKGKDDLDKR